MMEMGMKLDENCNGLNYGDRIFMIAGYIKDYKPVTVDIVAELDNSDTPRGCTYLDFKENRGYVDSDGYVWIFRKEPDEKEPIPWFTIVVDSDLNPKIKYNPRRALFDAEAFHISKVGDLSARAIIEQTTDKPVEYDESVLEAVTRATANVKVVINPEDDFLKRIVKTAIIAKGVNTNKYKAKVLHAWNLSNLTNALAGTTKTGPKAFLEWMELLDIDFEIKLKDNGHDKEDPLPDVVIYDSVRDKITVGEKEEDDGNDNKMARSVKV